MVETPDYGVRATWNGQGDPPRSDWDYDSSVRQAHMDALREAAGLGGPTPDQQSPISRANAEWAAMRQRRRTRPRA